MSELPISVMHRTIDYKQPHQEMSHYHNAIEIIHVKDGQMHCHVNNSDFLLGNNDLCIINTNQLHRIYCEDDQAAMVDVLEVQPDRILQNESVFNKYIRPWINDTSFAHIKVSNKSFVLKGVVDLLEQIKQLSQEKADGYELEVMGLTYMLFAHLYHIYQNQEEAFAYDSDITLQRRMVSYIYQNFQNRITLMDIAQSGGVSRSKCSNMFQTYAQCSPITFLNNYRLEIAANMLLKTKATIGEIALHCGFSEQSYFNRMFLKNYQCTPNTYRQKHSQ